MRETRDLCCVSNLELRTTLANVIARAGSMPWPKLVQNLRATRDTELAEQYPIQVVCEWIGNSQAVAKRHYLQVTESHFAKAISESITAGNNADEASRKTTRSAAFSSDQEKPGVSKSSENVQFTDEQGVANGRHRTRTCDFHRVRMAL